MSDRAIGKFMIVNTLGLHARAATKLVQLATRFPCEVEVAREDQSANGKSVMGVLLLCGSKGTIIEVSAKGERAQECVDALGELIASRFGEPS
jgi:phosphocarrier protein HPr